MIRLEAMIIYGINVSAFEWSLNKLSPGFVEFRDFQFLALIPYSTLAAGFRFFVFIFVVIGGLFEAAAVAFEKGEDDA
jgi:hypothetical protein